MSHSHVCQPFAGLPVTDPDFPRAYQRNPWCWSPELGFHRSNRPHERLHPQARPNGSRLVGKDHLNPWQAVRLGARLGTANGGPREIPESIQRLMEAAEGKGWDAYPDAAEAFARLGADMRYATGAGAAEYLSEHRERAREWIGGALRPFLSSPALGPWGDRLARAVDGAMPEEEARGFGRFEDAGSSSRRMWDGKDPAAWLDYNAAGAVRVIVLQDPAGAVRLVCRLVVITDPTPPEVVQWWRRVIGDAVRLTSEGRPADRPTAERYAGALRHTRRHVAKWRARGIVPPPHRCGLCGAMTEGPTLDAFEAAAFEHLREHDPRAEPRG